jgi:Flp pilus assembly protein protease CpaA
LPPIVSPEAIKLTLVPAMMAFAASSDLFTMTIANRVSLILVGGFALLAAMTGMSAADALSHAGAAAAVLAVVFVFFTRGWIGGGDAKLAAATVLWLGFAHLADYLVYASLFGGALTVALISFAPCRSRRCSSAGSGLSGCTAAAVAFPTVWRSRWRRFSSIRRPSGWRPSALEPDCESGHRFSEKFRLKIRGRATSRFN